MQLLYFNQQEEIVRHTNQVIEGWVKIQKDTITKTGDTSQVFQFFAEGESRIGSWMWTCELMIKVHTSADIRKCYNEQLNRTKDAIAETWTNMALYRHLKSISEKPTDSSQVDDRLIKRTLEKFERNGAAIKDDDREQYKKLSKKLAELCNQFNKNVADDSSHIIASKEELLGMSEDYLTGLKTTGEGDEKKYIVTMKYPDILPLLKKAQNDETRKRALTCFDNRAIDNLPILFEVVQLRKEIATLLGYKDHSSYILEPRMAKTTDAALNFLEKIGSKLKILAQKDIELLLSVKKEEKEKQGVPFENKLNEWEVAYYTNMYMERFFGIDDEVVKQYFPMEEVTKKILGVYQHILGLKFEEIQDETWHTDVRGYQVHDVATGNFIGKFYLDLFPRDGKYTHACAFPVLDTLVLDGERRPAIACMVANFSKPTPKKPSLLNHRELVTYFHEFGHVMHSLCSRSARNFTENWFCTEMDFVEAPSQMLENWCWDPEVLTRMSGHYENSEKIPGNLISSMISAKRFCVGIQKLRQTFYSIYDLKLHSQPPTDLKTPEDLSTMWAQMKKEIAIIEATPNTNIPAGWLHLCAGYDSGYYGYLWSEVFAADMFSQFSGGRSLDPDLGMKYRNQILLPGATQSADAMLQTFLGREPNEQAFFRELKIAE